jgi:hypothetical protein
MELVAAITPPNHPSSLPNLNTTPEHTGPPDLTKVTASIDEFLKILRPMIREFLINPSLPNWVPPESVDNETRDFYTALAVPLVNDKPSLLLHKLGDTLDPNVDNLFNHFNTKEVLRILCNTSGSGKTRLLFEGLCQNWGFYFVAAQGNDHIGARDLEIMIEMMSKTSGWISNIFVGRQQDDISNANTVNEEIADKRISKVILARWTVFRLFIEVAKELNGGALADNIRTHWLLFQILPQVRVSGMDPFLALIDSCLVGVTLDQLRSLRFGLAPTNILGSAFAPLDTFFYVLDEAQVAGKQYMGAFADANGKVSRPVLRPIIRHLVTTDPSIKIIISGTGFSLELFKTVVTSGVGKDSATWNTVHDTGDFSEQAKQLAYISRYVPSSFLISPSGEILKVRTYEWLRGRYVVAIISR